MNRRSRQNAGSFQLLTSPGPAAIAVVRVRGPACLEWSLKHLRTRVPTTPAELRPGRIYRAALIDHDDRSIDDMLFSVHETAQQWDVRLHLHGSRGVVSCCRELLERAGFVEDVETASTLWAAENRIVAEAYALTPRMLTFRGVQWLSRQSRLAPRALRRLLNMDDQEAVHGLCRRLLTRRNIVKRFSEPLKIALVGPPNVGKSTLANALADREISVVSPVPGTTRDWVEIPGQIDGFPVLWLDTAGLWRGGDDLDAEAMRRTRAIMKSADVVTAVFDPDSRDELTNFFDSHLSASETPTCVVMNKIDVAGPAARLAVEAVERLPRPFLTMSALQKTGLGELEKTILTIADYHDVVLTAAAPFTSRQTELLERAVEAEPVERQAILSECLNSAPPASE